MKGIAGFYYVSVAGSGIYECKAKGAFRQQKQKPLVGDLVEIEILDEAEKTGNMTRILPRKNELIRPAVANIDQALVIFALENPTPNLTLLDRFLVMMEQQNVPTAICFNKRDLAGEDYTDHLRSVYENCGYRVFTVSAAKEQGMQEVEAYQKNGRRQLHRRGGTGAHGKIHADQPALSRCLYGDRRDQQKAEKRKTHDAPFPDDPDRP